MPEHTPAPTPSRAVYGFAMYLSFKSFFVAYFIWAVVPEEWFQKIGITCLPQRHWAVTVPIFLLTALAMFAFVIYPSLGLLMTPTVDDLCTIRDNVSSKKAKTTGLAVVSNWSSDCTCYHQEKCGKVDYDKHCGDFTHESIPVLMDLNIWDVSERLYLK